MELLLVVVVVVIVGAIAALLLANPRMAKRRTASVEATTAAIGTATALAREDDASCFGVNIGDDKPRHYGKGSAAVTADSFIFTAVVSGETVVVPRSQITDVLVDTSHIVKRAPSLVLKLSWDDPEDGPCYGRWKFEDLEAWVSALGGATKQPDDDETAET